MGIKRTKILFNATTPTTGDWFRLDTRYEEDPTRPLHGTVTSGDSLDLEGTTVDVRGETDATVGILAEDITTLNTYTADFNDVLRGNWTYIRIVKTGSNGNAKVRGFI